MSWSTTNGSTTCSECTTTFPVGHSCACKGTLVPVDQDTQPIAVFIQAPPEAQPYLTREGRRVALAAAAHDLGVAIKNQVDVSRTEIDARKEWRQTVQAIEDTRVDELEAKLLTAERQMEELKSALDSTHAAGGRASAAVVPPLKQKPGSTAGSN